MSVQCKKGQGTLILIDEHDDCYPSIICTIQSFVRSQDVKFPPIRQVYPSLFMHVLEFVLSHMLALLKVSGVLEVQCVISYGFHHSC